MNHELTENLPVLACNPARNNALVTAAKHHMSSEELERRRATGTLDSSSLMAKAVQCLSANLETVNRYTKVIIKALNSLLLYKCKKKIILIFYTKLYTKSYVIEFERI